MLTLIYAAELPDKAWPTFLRTPQSSLVNELENGIHRKQQQHMPSGAK